MNRRFIFKGLMTSVFSVLTLGKALAMNKVFTMKPGSSSSDQLYKEELKYQSNRFPNKKYRNVTEFWNDHVDKESNALKKRFRFKGLLIESNSSLLEDGKTVVITKVYRSEEARNLYRSVEKKYFRKSQKNFPNDLRAV